MTMKSDFKEIFDEDGEEKLLAGKTALQKPGNDLIDLDAKIINLNEKIRPSSLASAFSL